MINSLDNVDPASLILTQEESVALYLMIDKVNRYVAKGRLAEANAARYQVLILWQALNREPAIDTGWGEL